MPWSSCTLACLSRLASNIQSKREFDSVWLFVVLSASGSHAVAGILRHGGSVLIPNGVRDCMKRSRCTPYTVTILDAATAGCFSAPREEDGAPSVPKRSLPSVCGVLCDRLRLGLLTASSSSCAPGWGRMLRWTSRPGLPRSVPWAESPPRPVSVSPDGPCCPRVRHFLLSVAWGAPPLDDRWSLG